MALHCNSVVAALEFTSLAMLGWLAAAAIPWLVHRWFRRPQRTMRWAAVDLLLTAIRQRSKRIHLQQWLLLAIRTAILVLVVLAAAGPLWRDWAIGSGGKARTHHVLVLDQSYSMTCQHDGMMRLERAKLRARQLIESSNSGDAFSVVSWGFSPQNVLGRATFDSSLAIDAVNDLQPAHISADLAVALRVAASAIDRTTEQVAAHNVVLLSDLGRNTWTIDPETQTQIESLAKRATLTLLDVGDAHRDNLAIVELEVEPALTLRQHQLEFVARVRGFGNLAGTSVIVELAVDGRHVDSQPIDLAAAGETEVRFSYSFVDEGAHTVEVSLAGDSDGLPIDDRRWLVVNVLPQLRVACFAASPGAADDVARALAPGGASPNPEDFSPIDPQVIPLGRLSQTDLTKFAAVMLCGASELSPREAVQIEHFARQGGGLAVLLGEPVASDGPLQALLPVKLLSQTVGEFRFNPLEHAHPVVQLFRGRATAGLASIPVNRYVRMQTREQHPKVETVLALNNGDPALVVDQLGLGRVAVMALPCSLAANASAKGPWSSFAVSPSFLPVVRELVSYLVGDRWQQQRNLLVGQQAACSASMVGSLTNLEIRLPTGDTLTLTPPAAEDLGRVFFADTATTGIYSWRANGKEFARFAVNLDTRESDLRTVDPAGLPQGFTNRATVAGTGSPRLSGNRSFARGLLGMALALLLTESTLAWLLGKGWG
jgi:hypothetical protein